MMSDVHATRGFAAEPDTQLNRLVLGRARAAAQENLVASLDFSLRSLTTGSFDRTRQFRMNNQRRAQPREFRHRCTQILFRDVGKFIYARMNQETFKAGDAGRPKLS